MGGVYWKDLLTFGKGYSNCEWLFISRFSTKHANECHFSFNFLTTLTHASSSNLELFDMPISEALERMKYRNAMSNTVFVIMGDHGQRIVR